MSVSSEDHRYSRQSFIGDQVVLEKSLVGVVGLGGGGSAISMQLAHMGFGNVVGFDPNPGVEEKHLNRTLGISILDVNNGVTKAKNAERVFRNLQPEASVEFVQDVWQKHADKLRGCKVIWGCLDSLSDREQLEAFCRSQGIPLIDIGLWVAARNGDVPRVSGQIILSMPGLACMHCLGFLTESDLAVEAAQYGDAGVRSQVIWGNFILAGNAVGLGVQLLSGWAGVLNRPVYLQYDGNNNTVLPHPRLSYLDLSKPCTHFFHADKSDSHSVAS